MTSHVGTFHSILEPVYNLGKPVLLEKEMFCCCGFSSTSGNKLAKHLGKIRVNA